MTDNFIRQTARDYDLDLHIVKSIHEKYGNSLDFYDRLEEEIKQEGEK